MILANGEERPITQAKLPAVWYVDEWQDPIHIQHLAAAEETVACAATPIQSRNGRINRLQLATGPTDSILVSTRESAELIDQESARTLLVRASCRVEGTQFEITHLHTWLRHPRLVPLNDPAADVLSSWEDALTLVEENPAKAKRGLRPPQIGALHAIAAHWTVSSAPALVVMPTGTGKTEVMLAAMIMSRPKRLLVIVPSDLLRQQTMGKFATLGVLQKVGALGPDALFPVVGGLFGVPQAADLERLAGCNVVVTTMSALVDLSSVRRRKFVGLFDVVFFDEAHHLPAATWESFHDLLEGHRVLQFTATPFRNDGRRMPGRIIYNFPLRLAQEQGYFQQMDFLEVVEPDEQEADRKIAAVAVARLRQDRQAGLDHLLLARTDTQQRAEELFATLYAPLYADLNPIVIHSGSLQRREKFEDIRARNHLIVICVDLFGEGYDLPQLKIAALHDVHKSLAITLQFIGRFTRTAAGLGKASIVANVADPKVSDAIEELYAEDSDWNEIIPKLSARAIQSQLDFSDFLQRMEKSDLGDDELFSLNVLRPPSSTLIFRVSSFNPRNFRTALSKDTYVQRVWISRERDYLVFITKTRLAIEWATIKEANDEVWDLFILSHDAKRGLLYLHSSQKKVLHLELAKAVGGKTAKIIDGETVFRAFHGLKRITMQNVGLKPRGPKLKFQMFVGPDVVERISPAAQINASKSNLFAMGYDAGKRVSIGVSVRGKIWSRTTCAIPDWRNWCELIADRLLDTTLPTNDYLQHTLMPKEVAELPEAEIFGVALSAGWFSDDFDTAAVIVETKPISPDLVGLEAWSKINASTLRVEAGAAGNIVAAFDLQWGPAAGQFNVVQQCGPTVQLRLRGEIVAFADYLKECPPTVFLADGAELEGGLLKSPRETLAHTINLAHVVPWDWSGVDLKVESKWKDGRRREASIQERVMQRLALETNLVVFDDDDAGESADVVEIIERADHMLFRFYHCKYSGAKKPGERAKDLYEVCGQAVRSTRWHQNPVGLIDHLIKRSLPAGRNGRDTRFAKGGDRALIQLKRKARQLLTRYEVYIVQPGLSKAQLEPETSTILGAANHFLLDFTGHPLVAITSK
ncbi:MAG TPA: DEAD/DEAH box helicase family protein [Lacunisphaera sp.]|jgi:superfamily II DNA or RNA helicase|nr:DEAD/DEAH box helicase family protein [Lacunisphaera sp.]